MEQHDEFDAQLSEGKPQVIVHDQDVHSQQQDVSVPLEAALHESFELQVFVQFVHIVEQQAPK